MDHGYGHPDKQKYKNPLINNSDFLSSSDFYSKTFDPQSKVYLGHNIEHNSVAAQNGCIKITLTCIMFWQQLLLLLFVLFCHRLVFYTSLFVKN